MSKLPGWVEFGAFVLVFIAGMINTVGLLGFQHQAISHITGTVALLSVALISQDAAVLLHLLLIVLAFMSGAALSGFIIQNATLKLGRRYGIALLLEAIMLGLALIALVHNSDSGHLFASAACGLQNAMVSTFSGAVIRTTHLTGVVTDLGAIFGSWLRGNPIDYRKVTMFLILITGFSCGAAAGAMMFRSLNYYSLLVPIILTSLLSLTYWLYWYKHRAESNSSTTAD